MKRRNLTMDEAQLWRHVTRNDTPLTDGEWRMADDEYKKPVIQKHIPYPEYSYPSSVLCHPSSVIQGDYANIDRNTATRFRKGDYQIDATLDLHGMTREKAYKFLMQFLHMHYGFGSRCLLVITGKGSKDAASPRGVLRGLLPQWIDDVSIKHMILAFDSAKPKHGGEGAYYILLKRKRA